MKVLVTGASGFIGKHVSLRLAKEGFELLKYDLYNTEEELISYVNQADFIINLAGVNRPLKIEEFYDGNANFTAKLVYLVQKTGKNTPIILSSSIQASLDNDYGKSKKMGEDFLLNSSLPVYVYRLKNVFGKWCRPNYNSAAATFCYNIAHGLDITIRDENYVVSYNYIDDIVDEFIYTIKNRGSKGSKDILYVEPTHDCSLGKLTSLLRYFKQEIESDRHLPIIHDDFELKLFKTFCDYLSDEGSTFNFASDSRGSFQELYKSKKYGQISENISFPGITKGGHYHTYKKEIFYTVKGKCDILQRNIKNNDIIHDVVSNDSPKLVDIIPMYTHQITNISDIESVTIMWISEIFNESTADTYKEEV